MVQFSSVYLTVTETNSPPPSPRRPPLNTRLSEKSSSAESSNKSRCIRRIAHRSSGKRRNVHLESEPQASHECNFGANLVVAIYEWPGAGILVTFFLVISARCLKYYSLPFCFSALRLGFFRCITSLTRVRCASVRRGPQACATPSIIRRPPGKLLCREVLSCGVGTLTLAQGQDSVLQG